MFCGHLSKADPPCRHVHIPSVVPGALGDAAEGGLAMFWHNSDQKQVSSTALDSCMHPSAWASWLAAPTVVPKEF